MTRHSFELHRSGGSSSSAQYSKQADISRLLDPAYAPSSPAFLPSSYSSHGSSSSSYSPPSPRKEVYIDQVGDLHDPDYRDFPAFPAPSPPKRRRATDERVPAWERAYLSPTTAYDDDEDEYDADEQDPFSSRHSTSRRHTGSSGARPHPHAWYYSDSPASRAHSPSPTSRAHTPTHHHHSYPTPAFVYDYSPRATSSIGHADDLVLEASREDDDDFEEQESEKPRRLLRRVSKNRKETNEGANAEDAEDTPSCTHALKVQLSAMALSFRLGVFRTKRRVRLGLQRTRSCDSR